MAISAKAQQAVNNINNRNLSAKSGVKIPETYLVEEDSATIPSSIMEYLLFQQISGQELLLISRNDLLNGQEVAYQPIKDISDIAFQYSSSNILSIPETLAGVFKQYGLVLENFIPTIDEDDERKSYAGYNDSPNAYVDNDSGSNTYQKAILVEFSDLQKYMAVEIEVVSSGKSLEDSFGL